MVTSPCRVARAAAVIATTSSSKCRPGSWTASAASTCTEARLGITATRSPAERAYSAAASATGSVSLSLGSTTISRACAPWIASSTSRVAGRRVGAPCTTRAPASAASSASPSPGASAITARVRSLVASSPAATWSPKWVMAIR